MTSLICECELTSWILNEQKRIEPRANPPDSSRKSIFCCSNLDQKTVMKFYIVAVRRYEKYYFLFAYRTTSLPFGVLAIRSGIWIFVFDEWGFGWGVKSQVSCTSSRFQTPPAPSIPSLSPSPSFNCRFSLRSTVLNHRFLHADGTSDGCTVRTRGEVDERQVREIWILTRLIKYILYRLRCEPADVLSS